MKFIRISLAVLCAILFVTSGVLSMLLFNLDQKAFTPEAYQRAFANGHFYQRLPTIIARGLVSSPQQDELPLAMQGLTVENWENFIVALLPPQALQSMGEAAMDSLFAYLNGEVDTAVISLLPLKESMASEIGTQAVLDLMRTQPDCTLSQIAQMTVAVLSEGEIMLCNPPEDALPLITPIIMGQLKFAAEIIPDQMTLARTTLTSEGKDPREQLRVLRALMRLSPLVPLGLLLALSLLVVRSLRDWLAWWGIPMLVTGLLAIVMSLLGAPFVGLLLLRYLVRNDTGTVPPVLMDSSSQLVSAIVEQLLRPTLLQGLAVAGVGLLLIVVVLLLRRFNLPDPGRLSEEEA